jgi:predicted acyltransferase
MRYVEVPQSIQKSRRIVSVDALRGFAIFWILGADGAMLALAEMLRGSGDVQTAIGDFLQAQFTHVAWEGFSFYDFIFPLFIFVTGVSIVPALTRLVQREGMAKAHLKVLRRAALLFGLGLIYNGGVGEQWSDIRVPRRAATYRALLSLRIVAVPEFRVARAGDRACRRARRLLGLDDFHSGAGHRHSLVRAGCQPRQLARR